jgi:hypothetical protein
VQNFNLASASAKRNGDTLSLKLEAKSLFPHSFLSTISVCFQNNKVFRGGCIGQEVQTRWLNIKKEDMQG